MPVQNAPSMPSVPVAHAHSVPSIRCECCPAAADHVVPGRDSERPEKRRKAKREPSVQPLDIDFDADITPEEMQMMQTMGIPFLFDTTQVSSAFPAISSTHVYECAVTRKLYVCCMLLFSVPRGIESQGINYTE